MKYALRFPLHYAEWNGSESEEHIGEAKNRNFMHRQHNRNFSRVKYNFYQDNFYSFPLHMYIVKISSCRPDIWRRRVSLSKIGVIPTTLSSGNDSICRICLQPLRDFIGQICLCYKTRCMMSVRRSNVNLSSHKVSHTSLSLPMNHSAIICISFSVTLIKLARNTSEKLYILLSVDDITILIFT